MKNKLTLILFITLIILSVISLFIGAVNVTIKGIFTDRLQMKIFLLSRLPRLLAVICTGVGLSISGLIMQQLTRNRFVSPSTGSTIQSAQLGILIALVFIPSSTLMSRALMSFVFAICGTCLFIILVQKIKIKNIILVPLVGIMLGNIISGITNFIAYKYEMTQALSSWTTGHFSTIIKGRYEIVFLVLPLVIIAYIFANHFNIVGMGKNFSKNLGINYNVILFLGIAICSVITASIIVIVGQISYVGLIVPNIIQIYKGDKLKNTLIDNGLFGAIFVLVCDILSRIIIWPYELPISLIIGIVGSIIFIILMVKKINPKEKRIKNEN